MKFVSMFGADICGATATQNKFYFGPSSFAASVVEKFRRVFIGARARRSVRVRRHISHLRYRNFTHTHTHTRARARAHTQSNFEITRLIRIKGLFYTLAAGDAR